MSPYPCLSSSVISAPYFSCSLFSFIVICFIYIFLFLSLSFMSFPFFTLNGSPSSLFKRGFLSLLFLLYGSRLSALLLTSFRLSGIVSFLPFCLYRSPSCLSFVPDSELVFGYLFFSFFLLSDLSPIIFRSPSFPFLPLPSSSLFHSLLSPLHSPSHFVFYSSCYPIFPRISFMRGYASSKRL